MPKPQNVIVSGMRPTGALHWGHYHGVITNWVKFQSDAAYAKAYFFVADWHALTTEYTDTSEIKNSTQDNVLDWLAYGVDPKKAVIFVQSRVPEHTELHLLLSMITPVGWLERVPSYKDLQLELSQKDLATYGFLGYPLLQTADVALYHGTHIPVGQDQVAHIELSREIVRRFNHIFKGDYLPEPQPVLTSIPKLPGTDGRKMSKSYNNSVFLSDTAEATAKKIMPMMTDPARKLRTDPGDPNKCPVFDYHRIYSTAAVQSEVYTGCTTAGIGCVDCKKKLNTGVDAMLAPFRAERLKIAAQKSFVADVIDDGCKKAQVVAKENMGRLKEIVKL